MHTQNDNEAAIAKAVDAKLIEDPDSSFAVIVVAVASSVGFLLAESDTQFLMDYARMKLSSGRKITP